MATATVIPVEAATLEQHAALDDAAHAAIAQTEDEDYKWLTDRLDAHQSEVTAFRTQLTELAGVVAGLRELLSQNQDQARTMIEAQTRMIETLTTNLANLSATALASSNATQATLETSSQTTEEIPAATVTETVTPTNVEHEESTHVASRKRLRRM